LLTSRSVLGFCSALRIFRASSRETGMNLPSKTRTKKARLPARMHNIMETIIHNESGAMKVKLNRRQAIREKCLDCSARSTKDVAECPMTDCALYPFRMGRGKQNPKDRNRAIRSYCLWCCARQPSEVRLCPSSGCPLHPFRQARENHQNAPLSQKNITGRGVFRPRWEKVHDSSSRI